MVASARNKQIWLATLGVPVLLLSLYPLQRVIAEKKESIAAQQQELLLRSGKLLKKLSGPFNTTAESSSAANPISACSHRCSM
jgi:hypothetical protein